LNPRHLLALMQKHHQRSVSDEHIERLQKIRRRGGRQKFHISGVLVEMSKQTSEQKILSEKPYQK
jgi:hypothetical protein